MALPTSGPLSFSAIANEQGIALSNLSLRSMSATAGFTTPDAVSEFYDYSAVTVTAFGLSIAYLDSDSACNATVTDFVRYHDGSGDLPVVNDNIYTDSEGTTLFNGQNLFYAMGILIPEFEPDSILSLDYIVINTSGVVTSRETCSVGGGPI
jgi:hypothetical protein